MSTDSRTNDENYVIKGWEDEKVDLNTNLLRGIYAFGFEKPSPIQSEALLPMISSKIEILLLRPSLVLEKQVHLLLVYYKN